jgi:murein DD-endopeptidase MepM/ murein hydrolase activator NlpD
VYILDRLSLRGDIVSEAVHRLKNGFLSRPIKCLLAMIFVFLLSSCTGLPKDRLVKNIRNIAQKENNISHGELLAKYNLIGFSGENICLFAKNYGDIVNNETHNKAFIKDMSRGLKNISSIPNKIVSKINIIYDRLVEINAQYHIISKSDLSHIKSLSKHVAKISNSAFDILGDPDKPSHHLASLARADKIIDDLPVFLPVTSSILTSNFGPRKLGKCKKKIHSGIDLAAHKHANIYAAANGVVIEIAASPSYGNFILIDHKKYFKTRYAHLHKLFVSRGDRIFQGQLIGTQGSTGHSTNDHLHFEVIYQNHPIDPLGFVGKEYSCRS